MLVTTFGGGRGGTIEKGFLPAPMVMPFSQSFFGPDPATAMRLPAPVVCSLTLTRKNTSNSAFSPVSTPSLSETLWVCVSACYGPPDGGWPVD